MKRRLWFNSLPSHALLGSDTSYLLRESLAVKRVKRNLDEATGLAVKRVKRSLDEST